MSRALGPRAPVTASTAAPGWIVLGCCWAIPAAAFVVWAAARAASAVAGGHVAAFGYGFCADLAGWHTRAAWPGVPTPLVITIAALGSAAAAAAGWAAWARLAPRWLHAAGRPGRGAEPRPSASAPP